MYKRANKEQPSWKDKSTVGCGFAQECAKRTLDWLQMIIYIDDHDRCEIDFNH